VSARKRLAQGEAEGRVPGFVGWAAVAVDRVERLTDLVALLLTTRVPLTLDHIAERVPGYPEGKDSRHRQFERDKDILRREGVPIEVVGLEGGAFGYRIRPDEYYLPDLALTDEERVALNVAVAAVQLDGGHGRDALLKLGGLERADVTPLAALPALPALPDLFEAHRTKATATFRYGDNERTVEPYALVARRGHWYMIGHDHLRDDLRNFRVDRIDGDVQVGEPGSFTVPAGFDPDQVLPRDPWDLPGDEPVVAEVLVDAVGAPGVVAELGEDVITERRADGSVVVRLQVTHRDGFRSWVLGFLDHACVIAPAELRDDMVAWLTRMSTP
jgi:proteasome accessory factor B